MRHFPPYDDGLDADGYPLEGHGGSFVYVHGQEEDCPAVCVGAGISHAWLSRLEFAAQLSRNTESPIETMMGLALHENLSDVEIIPQFQWRRYRIDWAVRRTDDAFAFVECDGAEFHTKPSDVKRDAERDAAATTAGIKVFRFTGSEIFRSAQACALVVRQWVMS